MLEEAWRQLPKLPKTNSEAAAEVMAAAARQEEFDDGTQQTDGRVGNKEGEKQADFLHDEHSAARESPGREETEKMGE